MTQATVRKLLYELFINRENSDGYARLFERAVIAVIILNLIALFFETIPIIYGRSSFTFRTTKVASDVTLSPQLGTDLRKIGVGHSASSSSRNLV